MSKTTRDETKLPANAYSRKNPFRAELIGHERLTQPGSLKDTRHFVISLGDSGLSYTPGDSLGLFASNSPQLVDQVIDILGFAADAPVTNNKGEPATLREVLLRDYTLNRANRKMMGGLGERIPQGEQRNRLMEIVDNDEVLGAYIYTRDYVDILKEFDEAQFESPEAFVSHLSPIVPRLYSIASSLQAHPGEAHEGIGIRGKALVETGKTRKNELRLVACGHCILPNDCPDIARLRAGNTVGRGSIPRSSAE